MAFGRRKSDPKKLTPAGDSRAERRRMEKRIKKKEREAWKGRKKPRS